MDVPRDVKLELRFDRFLLPATTTRQSIKIYTGSEDNFLSPLTPQYDVVERVVQYTLPEVLKPDVTYTVEIVIPKDNDDDGYRAFDGAPLREGPVPLTFDFLTGTADPIPPPKPTEDDLLRCAAGTKRAGMIQELVDPTTGELLERAPIKSAQCASGSCHDGDEGSRMGMDLSSPDGMLSTVINHVAHQAETGSKTGVAATDPRRFGVSMPRVDPFNPSNSYLLYKLVRKQTNYDVFLPCGSTSYKVDLGGECAAPSQAENERLREWFVRGEPMPLVYYLSNPPAGQDARQDNAIDLRMVQDWIRTGALCP